MNVLGVWSICEEAQFNDDKDPQVMIFCVSCHRSGILLVWLRCPYVCIEKEKDESFTSFFSACGSEQNNHGLKLASTLIATPYLFQTDFPLEILSRNTPWSAGRCPKTKTALQNIVFTLIIPSLVDTNMRGDWRLDRDTISWISQMPPHQAVSCWCWRSATLCWHAAT